MIFTTRCVLPLLSSVVLKTAFTFLLFLPQRARSKSAKCVCEYVYIFKSFWAMQWDSIRRKDYQFWQHLRFGERDEIWCVFEQEINLFSVIQETALCIMCVCVIWQHPASCLQATSSQTQQAVSGHGFTHNLKSSVYGSNIVMGVWRTAVRGEKMLRKST